MRMTSHRSDRGFSMFLVIMAMFITAMFVAAAFAAANGDLPLSGQPRDRKIAYAAAEAGLSFYETHLNADPDYWTNCDDVPAPNGTEPNPVNLAGAANLRWRNVTPGAAAQYTIEILPSAGNAQCVKGVQSTVLDQSTGTFRIRVTGRATQTSPIHRSIIATFKRKGFLDYLWFTDVEDKDPAAMSTQTERTNATNYCESGTPPTPLYRWQRPSSGAPSNACTEIQWITGDVIDGPLHSNDSLLICGAPQFGGTGGSDPVEVVPTNQPRVTAAGCTDSTDMEGVWKTGVGKLVPPTDDQPLKAIAQQDGDYYQGKTIIRLETDGTMTVSNGGQTTNVPMPDNGVIYVDSNSHAVCSVIFPSSVTYGEVDDGCGNVYVSGTYSSNLTIASANDIIIAPTSGGKLTWSSTDEALVRDQSKDVVLGLIANRFVRVGHAVSRSNGCSNVASGYSSLNLTVSAAILALQHSWMVDNYDCGMAGKLTVNGAIAQEWRGPVGTGGHASGYLKDYHYDPRLRYRSPPYFLSPVAAQWSAIRENEQVPAT
jgi:hypothetical protein